MVVIMTYYNKNIKNWRGNLHKQEKEMKN